MAITNATILADWTSGIGTEGAVLQVDNTNNRLGIGTTNPQAMLQVGTAVTVYGNSGIVSATTFYGDGANLTGVSGFATAISSTQGDFLNQVFVTAQVLPLGAGISATIISSSDDGNVAFTRAGRIDVGTGSTLHVSAGTTFITNVLGVF